jgi:hypothetical protein
MSYSDATSHTVISPGSTVISDGNPEQNLEGFEFDNFTPHQGINEPQQQNNNKHRQVLTEVSPSVLKKRTLQDIHGKVVKGDLGFDAEVGKNKPFDKNAFEVMKRSQNKKRRRGGKKSRKKRRKTLKRNFKRRRNTKKRRTKK